MATSMVSVAAARAAARKRVERDGRAWAAGDPADAVFDLPLHPPTEREVRTAPSAAQDWARSWRDQPEIRWTTRAWPSFGTQEVPDRLVLTGAEAIARFAGRQVQRDWQTMRDAAAELLGRFGDTEALRAELRRSAGTIAALDPLDRERLSAMLSWLTAHPDSGLRLRQLPVHGVHTKWLEQHRGVVTRLHMAITGRTSLGLVDKPVLVRIRVLDPALAPGGLEDVTLPLTALAALRPPAEVLILENLETLLALPPLPGAIAVLGGGYSAGGRLGLVPWLHSAHVRYWGDLDSHGFRILDDLRAAVPSVESLLMDRATLDAHRDLAVQEEQIAVGSLTRLTAPENETLAELRASGGLRVEQERLDWGWVLERLITDRPTAIRLVRSRLAGHDLVGDLIEQRRAESAADDLDEPE
jgi:hypothetical protein